VTGPGPGPGNALDALAHALGVQRSFVDVFGRRRVASNEALVAVLRLLGAELDRANGAPAALRAVEAARWRQVVEPVLVAWEGRPADVRLRLPAEAGDGPVRVRARSEDGGWEDSWSLERPATALPLARATVDGRSFVERSFELPVGVGPIPFGYHRLTVQVAGGEHHTTLMSAPARCVGYPARSWGVFLPLYALRRNGDRGTGDVTGLRALLEWTASLGGNVVATLPLFATFLGPNGPIDPSPYSPLSTRFWNELYVDVDRALHDAVPGGSAPDGAGHEEQAVRSLGADTRSLHSGTLIDYEAVAARKRRALEPLAEAAHANEAARRSLDRTAAEWPDLDRYAWFRAAVERCGTGWQRWPERLRDGEIRDGDVDPRAVRYHRFVQAAMARQLADVPRDTADGRGLVLDLPVGVHPDGYDVWNDRSAFVRGASVGAPPDTFFRHGQDWGTPPPSRDQARRTGYAALRARLGASMALATALRIDHVMGLHRLYWVPRGFPATDGVYVTYPAEEHYAVLAIESRATGAAVIGEDLGTVPAEVRRTHVVELELSPRKDPALPHPPADSVVALNTHDLPTFAGYLRGSDIEELARLGVIDADLAGPMEDERVDAVAALVRLLGAGVRGPARLAGDADSAELARATLAFLGATRAALVIANLEDLWGELARQNHPGTGPEEPNWRRRAARSFEGFAGDPAVIGALEELARRRRASGRMGLPPPAGTRARAPATVSGKVR
jgi:4-alpha-glucanotransferase